MCVVGRHVSRGAMSVSELDPECFMLRLNGGKCGQPGRDSEFSERKGELVSRE